MFALVHKLFTDRKEDREKYQAFVNRAAEKFVRTVGCDEAEARVYAEEVGRMFKRSLKKKEVRH